VRRFSEEAIIEAQADSRATWNCVLIHYSEIALRGQNRPMFESRLVANIRRSVRSENAGSVRKLSGRFVFELLDGDHIENLQRKFTRIPGISWFAFARRCSLDIESMKAVAEDLLRQSAENGETFAVRVNRADHVFPLTSVDVARVIGEHLVRRLGCRVSLDHPDSTVYMELTDGVCFTFLEKMRGVGGLPVGSEGSVLMLFSGGIDSPVAAWLLMRRGCAVDFVHFHAYRTNDQVLATKIPKLLSVLIPYCLTSRLILVPQYPFELASLRIPSGYRVAAFRRHMQRVAEAVATRLGSKALATGDSIGQVASQTLENLRTTDASSTLLVLRPLVTYDKEEIIALGKRIGTFELSIMPYKDCCSLLDRHPKTRVPNQGMEKLEAAIDPAGLVEESLGLAEVTEIRENEPPEPIGMPDLIPFREYSARLGERRALGR